MRRALRVILSFTLVFGAIYVASQFVSSGASQWYSTLAQPNFTPPSWLFAPVWLVAYAFLAIALARVLHHRTDLIFRRWAFAFALQLVFNVFWTILFFSLHGLLLSMIIIVLMWFAVLIMTVDTWNIDRLSFWLLLPYLALITFAMLLDIATWWIN